MVLDSRKWASRYGWNVLAEHAPGFDDYIAITTPSAWAVVKDLLPNPPKHVEFQQRMGEQYLESMVPKLPDARQVIAFGGGNALDVGKYAAWQLGKPLIMVPTIVSTGAIFQAPIAIRRSERWEFIFDTVAPEYLLFDFGVIRSAPAHLNCGGMGECICQLGAVGAWRWWDAQGLGGPAFDQSLAEPTETWVRERTTEFSQDLDDAGHPGETGITIAAEINRQRYDLPTHSDVPRRSVDHSFIIAFEWVHGREVIHSQGVSLGSLINAYIYGSDFDLMKGYMDACHVRYRPADIACTRDEVRETLDRINEPVGAESPENWFHKRTLDDATFERMMAAIEA